MKYYLGKGTEFKKEECKEYKTIDGAMRAAAKDESFVVWDENGNIIGSLTDNVPEGALETNPDGSVNAYDENGNKVGTVDAEMVAELTGEDTQETAQENAENPQEQSEDTEATNTPEEEKKDENEGNAQSEEQEDKVIVPHGKMRVTVVCDGALNIRRSASWDNENICGRAIRGQSYYVKEIHVVDGKKMVRTIGDLYLSGESEHVQFEQL